MFALATVLASATLVTRPQGSGIGTNPNQRPLERALMRAHASPFGPKVPTRCGRRPPLCGLTATSREPCQHSVRASSLLRAASPTAA
jgi:hypothetical protein